MRTMNNITHQFAMNQQLDKKFETRVFLGNGVTTDMVKQAALAVMNHNGAGYVDMSSEDMAKAVNCITSCERAYN